MATRPLKIMYLNPVADNPDVDPIFADMARDHKLPGTEVHVTALPKEDYGFSHIEFRTYEALVTRGIQRNQGISHRRLISPSVTKKARQPNRAMSRPPNSVPSAGPVFVPASTSALAKPR